VKELITLKAHVHQLVSGAAKNDKKPRVVVQFKTTEIFKPEITIINDCGLVLDQPLVVKILTADEPEKLDSEVLDAMNNHGQDAQ
jgi:hypothetical protein